MKIIHVPDYETLSRKTAQLIAAQVLCKPDSLLGLATGSSPVGAYGIWLNGIFLVIWIFPGHAPLIWTSIAGWEPTMYKATIFLCGKICLTL